MQKIKTTFLFLILLLTTGWYSNAYSQIKPTPSFDAIGGYISQQNEGIFIPTNGTVRYTDTSQNDPQSLTWTFEGGTPATSNAKIINVSYHTKGKYDVTLSCTNAAGTSEITASDMVQVGGRTSIWNMQKGETGDILYTLPSGGGYLTGTNNIGMIAFAEKFNAPATTGEISEIKIKFRKENSSNTEKLAVAIFAPNSAGMPSVELGKTTIKTDLIIDGQYTTITFPKPIIVTTEFFVVVSAAQNNTVAILSSSSDTENNTAYCLSNNNIWNTMEAARGVKLNLNIVPLFQYNELHSDKNLLQFNDKNNLPQSVTVSSNTSWKATPSAPWIRIDNVNPNSFTVALDDNTQSYKKGYITLTGGGIRRIINVEQAISAPLNLVAENDGDHNVKLNWKKDFVVSDDIYDDFESYTPFTLNPIGLNNWYYIDGDGLQTYSITNITYPNQELPTAFILFDPTVTTPPISPNEQNIRAHSGNKFLACFSSPYGAVNDWIISPELNYNGEFKFVFWAKSGNVTPSLIEKFKVMYSTSHESDFLELSNGVINPPAKWTRYEFTVPAGTKHVAINCISNRDFMLMIDDIFIGQGNIPASDTYSISSIEPALSNTIYNREFKGDRNSISSSLLEFINSQKNGNTKIIPKIEGSQEINIPVIKKKTAGEKPKIQLQQMAQLKSPRITMTVSPSTRFIKWHNNEVLTPINITGVSKYEAAIRFNAEDLSTYLGYQLTSVDLLINSTGTYFLKIYKNGKAIAYQPINNVVTGEFFRVDLTKPIDIDPTIDELLIGYEVSDFSGRPSVIDNTANVRNKGALIKFDGYWENLFDHGIITGNWMIGGVLKKTNQETEVIYNIYRQGEKIGETSNPYYTDENIPISGNICYTVTAIQKSGSTLESTKSNAACLTVKQLLTVTANDAERYFGEDNPNVTGKYTIDGFIDGDTDAMLSKKPVVSIDPLIYYKHLQIGSYNNAVEISGAEDNTEKYRFIYRNGTLNIKALENDASLASLKIDGASYTDTEIPELYTIDCDNPNKKINIEIFPNHPKATIELLSNNPAIVMLGNTITVDIEKPAKEKVSFAIIAHDGTTREEFSFFVERPFCTDASLKTIKINDVELNNVPELYTIDCRNMVDEVKMIITPNDPKATVQLLSTGSAIQLDNTITVNTGKPSSQKITFVIIAHDGLTKEEFDIVIDKYFVFDDIVITRWNCTMAVINNPANNGGYKFVSYKWYRNGNEISQNQSYYGGEEHTNGDKYYVEMTTDHGVVLRTCEIAPELRSLTIKAYPNPISGMETVYVDADVEEELLLNATIEVYSTSGTKVKEVKVTGRLTPITLESSSGTYIFRFRGDQGFTKELKVIKK